VEMVTTFMISPARNRKACRKGANPIVRSRARRDNRNTGINYFERSTARNLRGFLDPNRTFSVYLAPERTVHTSLKLSLSLPLQLTGCARSVGRMVASQTRNLKQKSTNTLVILLA